MATTTAPGLPADSLNAWLAAIGSTILVEGLRLAWTASAHPVAKFHLTADSLPDRIAEALPSDAELAGLAIARSAPKGATQEFPRKPAIEAYAARARYSREHGDRSLAGSVTDLGKRDDLDHSPFDPPVPKGITLGERIASCAGCIGDPRGQVAATLAGRAHRLKGNGLGFDHRRYLSPADPVGDVWIDPVIELLASVALEMLPIRGDGRRAAARGWTDSPMKEGSFTWPVWDEPLDAPAIDAYLDAFWNARLQAPHAYTTVPYRPRATSDVTRGYASRRLR